MALKHLWKVQLLKQACKHHSNNNTIIYPSLKDSSQDTKYNTFSNRSITSIMRQELAQINIDSNTKFKKAHKCIHPPWKKSKFNTNSTMTKFYKNNTSHETIRRTFNEKLNKHISKGFEIIYTDGSKTE